MTVTRREFIIRFLLAGGALLFSSGSARATLKKERKWYPAYWESARTGAGLSKVKPSMFSTNWKFEFSA